MKNFFIVAVFAILAVLTIPSQAGTPLWTFIPLTATTIAVPANGTATVQYEVTNQSSQTHILVMKTIPGVTQLTSGIGVCSNPFVLAKQQSCILTLQIEGSQVSFGKTNGPVVCEQGSSLQCYRPSLDYALNVNLEESYTVGGTVSGLSGTVTLLNNGGDANVITSNGHFTFSTPLVAGGTYNVTVGAQPYGQTCTVSNGTGTMGSSNVTNVNVTCGTTPTTLSASVATLALATNGNARTIMITNTGAAPAENLSINYPTWPTGTTVNSTCTSTLAASSSCSITITPGANATSNCNVGQGSAPTPGVITVSASNVISPVTVEVVVLTNGCIYQQGYVFAIDDTTATTGSISGKNASLTNISPGIQWYNGSFVATNAQSLMNGVSNTATIINVQGIGMYAAQLCANYTIDSAGNSPCTSGTCYSSWYLPAICEMGAAGEGAGCSSGIANMAVDLPGLITGCSGAACLSGNYWSSTESATFPMPLAWLENFNSAGNLQAPDDKNLSYAVRCTRVLT